MATTEQRLAGQVSSLSQTTADHMSSLRSIFKAIWKVAESDPDLAAELANAGAYLVELAEGDFDTICMNLERVGKEIH